MATTLQAYHRMSLLLDGEDWETGSLERPFNVAVAGTVHSKVVTITNATNTALFAAELTTFDYLYIASDFDVRLAMTDNSTGTLSVNILGTGEAGKYGAPFVLHSILTTNATTVINAITAFNTSGSTAKVKIVAVT